MDTFVLHNLIQTHVLINSQAIDIGNILTTMCHINFFDKPASYVHIMYCCYKIEAYSHSLSLNVSQKLSRVYLTVHTMIKCQIENLPIVNCQHFRYGSVCVCMYIYYPYLHGLPEFQYRHTQKSYLFTEHAWN